MVRSKTPARLDAIIGAATAAFTESGYARAKVHRIADAAGVGPGTVYLYAGDKEALFELTLLRALESPVVAHPALPYQKTEPLARQRLVEECLREVSHFPQLWVAVQRRQLQASREEYLGILLELIAWVRRYRNAILLADRNRLDWPDLSPLFQAVIWNDVHRRLTTYLATRMRAGQLEAPGDPAIVARFTLDSVIAYLVTGPLEPAFAAPGHDDLLVRLVAGALISGDRVPLAPDPRQDPSV